MGDWQIMGCYLAGAGISFAAMRHGYLVAQLRGIMVQSVVVKH